MRQDGESKVARIRMTKNSGVSYFTQNPFFFPYSIRGKGLQGKVFLIIDHMEEKRVNQLRILSNTT